MVRLADGRIRKVARGDRIEGWRVGSIGKREMRLDKNGRSQRPKLVTN